MVDHMRWTVVEEHEGQKLAEDLREAQDALNLAIQNCNKFGLTVGIQTMQNYEIDKEEESLAYVHMMLSRRLL